MDRKLDFTCTATDNFYKHEKDIFINIVDCVVVQRML